MKYFADKNSSKPIYLQLYEQIREDIEKGIYQYGKKLPSKRLLAEEVGVSVITVEHVYGLLYEEGYVDSVERSGYLCTYKKSDFISEIVPRFKSEDFKSSSDVTYHFPHSVMAKKMRKVISEYGEELYGEPENTGLKKLREAISGYLARSFNINAPAERIVIGSGSEYLYGLIAQLFKGKTIALEDPCYEQTEKVYLSYGREVEKLRMGVDGIASGELKKSKATLLHVTPFKSYPSGVTASAGKRREYLEWAERVNGYIIEDNFESELTPSKKNEQTLFCMSGRDDVIYMNTFTRTVSRAIRTGYMVLPEPLIGEFTKKLGFYSCTVPLFEQYLLAELIESGDFERHVNRVRKIKRKCDK